MTTPLSNTSAGILLYPGVSMSAVHGLEEMFEIANGSSASGSSSAIIAQRFDVTSQQVVGDLALSFRDGGSLGILIIPPTTAKTLDFAPDEVKSWIIRQHSKGCVICSVCGGTYLLAETGLLNGRSATTHWSLARDAARRFPHVDFDTEKLLIDDGDIVTAGGVTAWMQLGLQLIDRIHGVDTMLATAKYMLIDAGSRPQIYYASFTPRLDHDDPAIKSVQRWLSENASQNITLSELAGRAKLTTRTFLRRFFRVTAMNPTEYCQRLRIDRSRGLLEQSRKTIDEISWECGYEDQGAYRKLFKRYLGITPGEYRTRLSVRPATPSSELSFTE